MKLFFVCCILLAGFTYLQAIEDGEDAAKQEFPFVVSLQTKVPDSNGRSHFCGGIIFLSWIVVTSASCVYEREAYDIEVRAGFTNLSNPNEPGSQRRDIAYIGPHLEYNPETGENDLATLLLAVPFVLNQNVQEAPKPDPPSNFVGDCTVIGWGDLGQDVLQKVNMSLVDHATCAQLHSNSGHEIGPNMFCARGTNPAEIQGPCHGDVGGPLICKQPQENGEGIPVVAGTLSNYTMHKCGNSAYPSIYTNPSEDNIRSMVLPNNLFDDLKAKFVH